MTETMTLAAPITPVPEAIQRMAKDIKASAAMMSDAEARFLVDYYYVCQEDRKRFNNQDRSLKESGEPSLIIQWLAAQAKYLEGQVKAALDVYTQAHPMGSYMRCVVGIGPVISAGLLAHIKIAQAPTAGHIWRVAGLDPTTVWGKGEKRPFNAKLKVLCWKAGQSFMKFSGRDDCYYGKLYLERKAFEVARNESGGNRDAAEKAISKYAKNTEAYKHVSNGVLPPAQIDARARRWAVKQFLSDMHAHWYRIHHGVDMPPNPYPIAHMGHAHLRTPPAYDLLRPVTHFDVTETAIPQVVPEKKAKRVKKSIKTKPVLQREGGRRKPVSMNVPHKRK